MSKPHYRFKQFNQTAWSSKTLGELVSFSRGKGLSKKDVQFDIDGVPCVLYGQLYTHFGSRISTPLTRTDINKAGQAARGVQYDILVPASGESPDEIARAACVLFDGQIVYGGDLNVLRPLDTKVTDSLFLTYQINGSRKRDIASRAHGATVAHISGSALSGIEMRIPSLAEQEAIATFLGNLDDQIAVQTERIDLLKKQKQELLRKIFRQELRFTGFVDEWEVDPLSKHADLIMGQAPSSSSYTPLGGEGLPFIGGNADIKKGVLTPRTNAIQGNKQAAPDDIVMTVRAPVGDVAKCDSRYILGRGVCAVRPRGSSEFLYFLLEAFSQAGKWDSLSQGTTFAAVNAEQIKNIAVEFPAYLAEQEAIAALFDNLDSQIVLRAEGLELLKTQKRAYLSRLFV